MIEKQRDRERREGERGKRRKHNNCNNTNNNNIPTLAVMTPTHGQFLQGDNISSRVNTADHGHAQRVDDIVGGQVPRCGCHHIGLSHLMQEF